MQKIDFQKFLFAVQGALGEFPTRQKLGFEFLVDSLQADTDMVDLRWAAYTLATTYHETSGTMQPIEEYGKGGGKVYGAVDLQTGQRYYGRGLTQLTWKANYERFKMILGKDLVNHPELALEPETAYEIMSIGMRRGFFTGVGLGHYFNNDKNDPVNARRIINGVDCAEKIAGYHAIFLKALDDSLEVTT